MDSSLPVTAGVVASVVFACSALPMLGKAVRSKDLASYSRSNLVLANVGNAVYSVYVFSLPPGPIWLLHTFYIISSALMLVWSLRYGGRRVAEVTAADAATTHVPATATAARIPAADAATLLGVSHAH
jgi:hypothetical protein